MKDRHAQSGATRSKIGAAVGGSAWRRKSRDKPSEMQSAAGQWDEDFSTPARGHHSGVGLWEEIHNRMVWK